MLQIVLQSERLRRVKFHNVRSFLSNESMTQFLPAELFRIGYFNGLLVAVYIVLLTIFLYGVLRPRQPSEWKSAGAAQAWVIALYAEMYGIPLTAYLVMGWLGRGTAEAERHFNGHLWPVILGFDETQVEWAQFLFTVVGQTLVLAGALLAIIGWRQLHRAVRENRLAQNGLYRYVRHPQYTGFFLFLLGSMINWPTLITMVTLPILWVVYLRLARTEERLAIAQFGDEYRNYMTHTGRFVPWLGKTM